MPIKFKFDNRKITTDVTFYMFSEFVAIWDWDRSKNKEKAHSMLYFVYLLCDLNEENPLKDEDPSLKEAKAFKYAYGSKKSSFTTKELSLVEPAIACYNKYNGTPEERLLNVFDVKAVELREEIENTVPEVVEYDDMSGTKFASNSDILTKGLQELNVIKKSKMSIIAAIKRESLSNKVRGQIVLSPLSKGIVTLPDFSKIEEEVENVQTLQGEDND